MPRKSAQETLNRSLIEKQLSEPSSHEVQQLKNSNLAQQSMSQSHAVVLEKKDAQDSRPSPALQVQKPTFCQVPAVNFQVPPPAPKWNEGHDAKWKVPRDYTMRSEPLFSRHQCLRMHYRKRFHCNWHH